MNTPARRDDPLEREYQSLTRKLRLAQGFAFVVYFVEDQRASLYLKSRLRDEKKNHVSALMEIAVGAANDLASQTLNAIFAAASRQASDGSRLILWVEAFHGPAQTAWQTQRIELLMRMNERRSRFESELRCPLILLLPAGAQREVATLAPDLWHVRLHSAVLSMVPSAVSSSPTTPLAGHISTSVVARAELSVAAGVPVSQVPRAAAYWESLWASARAEAGTGTADAASDESALDNLSLWDGFAAIDAWLAIERPTEALEIANRVLDLARGRTLRNEGIAEHPERLAQYDLAVALSKVGDAQRGAGRLEAALAAYHEWLGLTRGLRVALGDGAQVLHDLSTALVKVGDIERDLDRDESAAACFRESLELARLLHATLGASSQAMRNLSISLDRVGDADRAAGRGEPALASYRESLALRRQLHKVHGDDPEMLRELWGALTNVGDVELDSGRGESALAAYRESLELARRLRAALGDTPQVLQDLTLSLVRLASCEALDVESRRRAAIEALSLQDRLGEAMPDARRRLSHLDIARNVLDELGMPTSA